MLQIMNYFCAYYAHIFFYKLTVGYYAYNAHLHEH